MANDWIKMRVWLCRDPRVIKMADHLAFQRDFMSWLTDPVQVTCDECAYEHVTRNVTVALCVTGLLVTWGTAREQGDRVGDDLIVKHTDLLTLDYITDIPCFGEAMAKVGWAEELPDGSLLLPNFFLENESPDDRHRRQAAERQARFREKNSNADVTPLSNVTVTHREEKRREDSKKKTTSSKKFVAPELAEVVEYGRVAGLPASECSQFLDYQLMRDWTLQSGQKIKDWKAALRTWRDKPWRQNQTSTPKPKPVSEVEVPT